MKLRYWSSVNSKLPETGEWVLVCDSAGRICSAYYHGKKSGWIKDGYDVDEPTHWMPLPKPPKR